MKSNRLPQRSLRLITLGVAATLALACPVPLAAEAPGIDHKGVGCVIADKFPRFEARFNPANAVGSGRLRFRPEGGRQWYSVAMKAEAGVFAGVLPKPKQSLKKLNYYIEVTDKAFATGRTEEYAPVVASGPGACESNKIVAGALSTAEVVLEAPAGAAAIPEGFSASGVTSTVAGAAVVGAAAGATAGAAAGGIGGTALVVGGVAAAAVVGVAVSKGGGGPDPSPTPPPCTPGPVTASLSGATLSLRCGQPFTGTIAVANQSCATVTVQSVQLTQVAVPGPTCSAATTQNSYTPTVTSLAPGQTATVLPFASAAFCCSGGPCQAAGSCQYNEAFTVVTSAGSLAAGSAQTVVSFDQSCPVCSGSAAPSAIAGELSLSPVP